MIVRPTTPADHDAVLTLVMHAFSDTARDGNEEVGIVADTWALAAAPDGFDLVAADDGIVVGHILGAWGDLDGRAIVGIAPLAVAPGHQRRGVGTALMTELLSHSVRTGLPMVVLLGDPAYYGRFGFEPAGQLGITYRPVGADNPHFQVRRLPEYDPSARGDFTYCWERQGPQ